MGLKYGSTLSSGNSPQNRNVAMEHPAAEKKPYPVFLQLEEYTLKSKEIVFSIFIQSKVLVFNIIHAYRIKTIIIYTLVGIDSGIVLLHYRLCVYYAFVDNKYY